MTEATKVSLDEAARLSQFSDWQDVIQNAETGTEVTAVRAHALTLDHLHNRKHPEPVDPLAGLLADVLDAVSIMPMFKASVLSGDRKERGAAAIAILRAALEQAAPVELDDTRAAEGLSIAWAKAGMGTSWRDTIHALRAAGFLIVSAKVPA